MKKILTSRQFEVLNILWNAERPLLVSEIVGLYSLNVNTVQTAIKKLIKLGYVEIADIIHSKNVLARTYKPIISKDDYLSMISSQIGKTNFSEVSLISLVKKEDNLDVLNVIEQIVKEKLQR